MAFQQQHNSAATMQLAVKGWALPPSKFAADPVSGEQAVVIWLEKRAQRKIVSHKAVGKTHVLLIDINPQDAQRFYHLNGFTFSGAPVTVEESKQRSTSQPNGAHFPPSAPRNDGRIPNQPPSGPRGPSLADRISQPPPSGPRGGRNNSVQFNQPNNQSNRMAGVQAGAGANTHELEQSLITLIHSRYNANEKYITFEALALDQHILQSAQFENFSPSKLFAAIFRLCEAKVFETPAKRKDMVHSVSLANNNISSIRDVIGLSATFPNLKNLDLSGNQIKDLGDMKFWRNAFRDLEHLILTGNPIDQNTQAKESLVRWFRNLKLLNGAPVTRGQSSTLQPGGLNQPRSDSPAPFTFPPNQRPTQGHPEFEATSTFGMPEPGKPDDQLLKEQQGLKFSFDTGLKMSFVEQALVANNFDYDAAMRNFLELRANGGLPADAFVQADTIS